MDNTQKGAALLAAGIALYFAARRRTPDFVPLDQAIADAKAAGASDAYIKQLTDNAVPIQEITISAPKLPSGSRGLRNNNPGNIRKGASQWAGMAAVQDDPSFVKFVSPHYGIRALGKLLTNYYGQGFTTIRQMIAKYAPASENNTTAYIAAVSKAAGVPADSPISPKRDLQAIVTAIIIHENGSNPYSADQIATALNAI